jgi:ribosomal protein S18 acetylase RimI-like enzyme
MLRLKPNQVIRRYTSQNGTEVIIRTPCISDLDDMLQFINDLVEEQAMILANKKMSRKDESKWLRGLLLKMKNGDIIQLSAEVDGHVVGTAEIKQKVLREEHVGILGISISKRYRNLGIGKVLIAELIRLSKKKGLKLITLEVFETNSRALHVYTSMGFVKRGVIPKHIRYKNRYVGSVQMSLEL